MRRYSFFSCGYNADLLAKLGSRCGGSGGQSAEDYCGVSSSLASRGRLHHDSLERKCHPLFLLAFSLRASRFDVISLCVWSAELF